LLLTYWVMASNYGALRKRAFYKNLEKDFQCRTLEGLDALIENSLTVPDVLCDTLTATISVTAPALVGTASVTSPAVTANTINVKTAAGSLAVVSNGTITSGQVMKIYTSNGTSSSIMIGRTSASDLQLGVCGSANAFFTGTATADVFMKQNNASNKILFAISNNIMGGFDPTAGFFVNLGGFTAQLAAMSANCNLMVTKTSATQQIDSVWRLLNTTPITCGSGAINTNATTNFNISQFTSGNSCTMIRGETISGQNMLHLGGGGGTVDAMTQIWFWAASATETDAGSYSSSTNARAMIDSTGLKFINSGISGYTPTGLNCFEEGSGTATILYRLSGLGVASSTFERTFKITRIGNTVHISFGTNSDFATAAGSSFTVTPALAIPSRFRPAANVYGQITLINSAAPDALEGGTFRVDFSGGITFFSPRGYAIDDMFGIQTTTITYSLLIVS